MTALTSAAALAAILALTAWTLGGLLLRTLGSMTVLAGLLITATGHPAGLLLTTAGLATWLAGHYLYAARHHAYKSPLARRICTHPRLTKLDVTRGWTPLP
ncbi:hypothetical protein NBH00_21575 [Paraconexibacter antarcticus]|uniref:Uncharacterized protein n=1 Tax=Paraconexibacter antarcticus TaxID=2949664 RepID=A0ABY5DPG3_9ACTN|nr:hypothetical protein [Paraconexibacter antarcticus]UTI63920.1 hypothetical protein NBH00_21575 [Paraconexibacter antarcticus]